MSYQRMAKGISLLLSSNTFLIASSLLAAVKGEEVLMRFSRNTLTACMAPAASPLRARPSALFSNISAMVGPEGMHLPSEKKSYLIMAGSITENLRPPFWIIRFLYLRSFATSYEERRLVL